MTEKPKRKPNTGFSYEEGWNDGLEACEQWMKGRIEQVYRAAYDSGSWQVAVEELEQLLKEVSG